MLKALSVAGYDGSSGAGITSDIKIFSKFGLYGLSVITAITAQNPEKIYAIQPVNLDMLKLQLKAIFDYFNVDCIKIGLIYDEKQSELLAKYISKYNVKTVVVDPVFISTSGKKLITESQGSLNYLNPIILEYATVITPNIFEAEILAEQTITDVNSMKTSAIAIKNKFPQIKNIIIKGSHLGFNEIIDIALNSENERSFFIYKRERIKLNKQMHGTGCAFSAALISFLSKGQKIDEALINTEKFVEKIIMDYKQIPDNDDNKQVYITSNI
jgi:hydroxymethylpyrimidine/phosphomethylpyrimidine kinase